MRQASLEWICGFLFSCLFIWAVASIFYDSAVPVEYDALLKRYVRAEGVEVRKRSEGWGNTRIGRHGLIADGDIVLDGPGRKFILWADSHGQAFQVDDDKKITTVFNELSDRVDMKGVILAEDGLSVADYYYDLPRMEKAYPTVVGHVVMLSGVGDILPGYHLGSRSRFAADPWRFEESHPQPSRVGLLLGKWIYSLRLKFVYDLYAAVRDHSYRFEIGGGEEDGSPPVEKGYPTVDAMREGWDFMLQALKSETNGFLVFVYNPLTPFLGPGGVVHEDPEDSYFEAFAIACKRNGVGFIDMTQVYSRLYERDKVFVRGFFNTMPGLGHTNEDGLSLIAHALNAYLKRVDR